MTVLDKCPSCGQAADVVMRDHCDHGKCEWLTCRHCTAVVSVRTGKHMHGRKS